MVLDYFSREKRTERLKEKILKSELKAQDVEEEAELRSALRKKQARISKHSQVREFGRSAVRGAGMFARGTQSTVQGISKVAGQLGGQYDKKPSQRSSKPYFEHTLFGEPLPKKRVKKGKKGKKKGKKGHKKGKKKGRG